ncbi:MAG: CsbD family protein [Caldilineaceae bacterium]|nr:CsbD family protein [Caldilineaceae bacterium]
MNQDILQGKWKELRGGLKKQWGKLTDDDIRRIEGSLDQITGIIQQRYGYTKERAEHEIDHFLKAYQDHMQDYGKRVKAYGDQLHDYSEDVQSKVRSAVSDASEKVQSPFVKKKKSGRRRWFVLLGGLILSALIVYLFNQQQQPTNYSSGTSDYRKGM